MLMMVEKKKVDVVLMMVTLTKEDEGGLVMVPITNILEPCNNI